MISRGHWRFEKSEVREASSSRSMGLIDMRRGRGQRAVESREIDNILFLQGFFPPFFYWLFQLFL